MFMVLLNACGITEYIWYYEDILNACGITEYMWYYEDILNV